MPCTHVGALSLKAIAIYVENVVFQFLLVVLLTRATVFVLCFVAFHIK